MSNLIQKAVDSVMEEIRSDVECIANGKEIDFLSKFREEPSRRDPDWKWFFRDGDWVVIHGDPNEYYLSVSDINYPFGASNYLWDLKERPWFTRDDAKKYLAFVNDLNGWQYDINSLMKIAHPFIKFDD